MMFYCRRYARDIEATDHRKAIEIVESAFDKLVVGLAAGRCRRDHEARAQHINWFFGEWPNAPPLAVVTIPSLIMAAPGADNDWRLAISVERIAKHPLFVGIDIHHRDAAARAWTKPDCIASPTRRRDAPASPT